MEKIVFSFWTVAVLVMALLGGWSSAQTIPTTSTLGPVKPEVGGTLTSPATQNRTASDQSVNKTSSSNSSGSNSSSILYPVLGSGNVTTGNDSGILEFIRDKNGALMRTSFVILGVTVIVVIYFLIRSCRLRRKRSKSRKYGIIAKKGDLEMTPLDQDDDDEDMTVFEAPNHVRR